MKPLRIRYPSTPSGHPVRGAQVRLCLVLALLPGLWGGCASLRPGPFAGPGAVDTFVQDVARQESLPSSCVSTAGRLTVLQENQEDILLHLLMVGVRDPFRFKMEITHPWGRPILHLLIEGEAVRILSFEEKRVYVGTLEALGRSRLLPTPLDAGQLWTLVRGYPALLPHQGVRSPTGRTVEILDGEGETIQILTPSDRSSSLPQEVFYPDRGLTLRFRDYTVSRGIPYARGIRVEIRDEGAVLVLGQKEILFDREIPEAVFRMESPPGFPSVPLEAMDPGAASAPDRGR